jgi:hypothetical protein
MGDSPYCPGDLAVLSITICELALSIAQQKFATCFGAPAQYFKQLGNNRYQPGIYL